MKKLFFLLLITLTINVTAQTIFTPDTDEFQLGFTGDIFKHQDKTVFQFGAEGIGLLRWGYIGAGFSFADMDTNYLDIIGKGGVNFHLFSYERIRYYSGARLGLMYRDFGNKNHFYPLVGGEVGFDWYLNWRKTVALGVRYYIDYREDQKEQFYGDYDAYERGFLVNNPLLQENVCIVLSFKL